eukprot:1143487-Pelagomonas_calceolata.AAC.4
MDYGAVEALLLGPPGNHLVSSSACPPVKLALPMRRASRAAVAVFPQQPALLAEAPPSAGHPPPKRKS